MNNLIKKLGSLSLVFFSFLMGQVTNLDSIYVYKFDSSDPHFSKIYQRGKIIISQIDADEVDSLVFVTKGPMLTNGDIIYIYNRIDNRVIIFDPTTQWNTGANRGFLQNTKTYFDREVANKRPPDRKLYSIPMEFVVEDTLMISYNDEKDQLFADSIKINNKIIDNYMFQKVKATLTTDIYSKDIENESDPLKIEKKIPKLKEKSFVKINEKGEKENIEVQVELNDSKILNDNNISHTIPHVQKDVNAIDINDSDNLEVLIPEPFKDNYLTMTEYPLEKRIEPGPDGLPRTIFVQQAPSDADRKVIAAKHIRSAFISLSLAITILSSL